VAVVGGGLAGLAAAWRITRAGAEAVVLERKSSPGGRAGSSVDGETGEPVDTGQHIFMGCYRSTLSWFAALGTRPLVRLSRALEVPWLLDGGGTASFRAVSLPAPFHLLGGLLAIGGLTFGDRLRLLRLAGIMVPGGRLDGMSVAAWEDKLGVPRAVRDLVLDPLALAALNETPAGASALPFVAVLRALALGGRRGSAIGFAAAGLGDTYVGAASAVIERGGGGVRGGAWANGLLVRGSRIAGVKLAGGEEIEADAVVLAVPPWDLSALAAGVPELSAIAVSARSLKPSPILTVHLWWNREVFPGLFAGLAGSRFDWLFNRTALVGPGKDRSEHLCVVKSAARGLLGMKPAELAGLAESELRSRLPGTNGAKAIRSRTVWETGATVSLAPGTDRLRPGAATPVKGLLLAGDWTATGLPATIEGAVRSGFTAARGALAAI